MFGQGTGDKFLCALGVFFFIAALSLGQAAVPHKISSSGTFTPTASLPGPTAGHGTVVLANRDVLVIGGYVKLFGKIPIASTLTRIFDHEKLTWRVARNHLNFGRVGHGMIVLSEEFGDASGKVLIAGGIGQTNKPLKSVELFDPVKEKFVNLPSTAVARASARLTLLPGGRVLISGGDRSAEILERNDSAPTGFVIRETLGKCKATHIDHASVTLQDGSVLLIGGRTRIIERFDPNSETFRVCLARLPQVLDDQTVMSLYDGTVLIVGGQEVYSNRCVSQTWIYDPNSDILRDGAVLKPTALGEFRNGISDMIAVDLFADDIKQRGRYIFICGGEDDPGRRIADVILDSAWIYDAQKRIFIDVGPMLNTHDDFGAVPLPALRDGKNIVRRVLIISGHGTCDIFQSDCEIFAWPIH